MSVKVKPGVTFNVIAPAGYMILDSLKAASKTLGFDLTITSGDDGAHSGPTDPHKTGEAYDVRSNDLAHEQKAQVLHAVMGALEMGRFYGFLEGMDTANEHFHFQRSKGTAFSAQDMLDA
jgi:hypothetical protein